MLTEAEIRGCCSPGGGPLSPTAEAIVSVAMPGIERAIRELTGIAVSTETVTEFLPMRSPGPFRPPEGLDAVWEVVGGWAFATPRRGQTEESQLPLTWAPVRSITAAYENPAAWVGGTPTGDWPAATLLDPQTYYLDQDELTDDGSSGYSWRATIVRRLGVWGNGPRTVKVQYVCGMTPAELAAKLPHFRLAAMTSLGYWWGQFLRTQKMIQGQGLIAESVGIKDFSVAFRNATLGQQLPGGVNGVLPADALGILLSGGRFNLNKYLG